MGINEEFEVKLRKDLIHIMKIENEPESIIELDNWIKEVGIVEVSNKIIKMYSIHVE